MICQHHLATFHCPCLSTNLLPHPLLSFFLSPLSTPLGTSNFFPHLLPSPNGIKKEATWDSALSLQQFSLSLFPDANSQKSLIQLHQFAVVSLFLSGHIIGSWLAWRLATLKSCGHLWSTPYKDYHSAPNRPLSLAGNLTVVATMADLGTSSPYIPIDRS